jgi:AraC-like DNA-binding protein
MPADQKLLANHVAFSSTNVDEVRQQITRYFKPHDICFLDGRSELNTVLRRTRIGHLAVNLLEYGGSVMIDPGALDSFYLIHLNLAGQCELTSSEGHMIIDKNRGAICAPHRPYRFWWQPESVVAAIQIPKERLHAHLRQLSGRPCTTQIDFDLAMKLDSPAMESFLDLVRYMLCDASAANPLSDDHLIGNALEQTLLTSLLRLQPGSHQEMIAHQDDGPVPAYVKRADRFLRDNLERQVRLEEMASVAGVSPRTLTLGFQRFRGIAPGRYFLDLRLAQARKRLMTAEPGRTVADIAFELGFQHLSGFAAAYRQRYDEAPSATLRRAGERI